MNRTQRFFACMFGPGVERESREWKIECPHCAASESVWDKGGIRYKATGTKHMRGRCSACNRTVTLKVHRRP